MFCVRPGEADLRGFFGADPIEDCDLTPDGLSTPTLAALLIEEATRDRFVAYLASKRQQREAREARERQEREARLARERQERERRWLESDVRKAILDRYGYIPSELRDDGGLDSGILAHPEHWRAAIYHDLVLLKDPGSRFTFVQCRHSLRRHGIELQGTVDLMTQIIDRFLKHLHRQGVVCRCRNKWSCEIDYVQVVATIEMAEEARQQQAQRDEEERLADQQRRRREKERRVQQAATVFAARRTRQTRSLTASADAPVRQDEQATVPCRA